MKKNIAYIRISLLLTVFVAATSCVERDLYETPHPAEAKLTVKPDWSARGVDAAIPENYIIEIAGASQEASGDKAAVDRLLSPGTHRLAVYNIPDGISVSGDIASVNVTADGTLTASPGYLFSGTKDVDLQADKDSEETVLMRQHTRKLTFIMSVADGDRSRVSSVSGSLDGICGSVDIVSGEKSPGILPVVQLFANDNGKYVASYVLAGVYGRTTLSITVTFNDSNKQVYESDITEYLSGFNEGVDAVVLTGDLHLPAGGGFSGFIGGWHQAYGGNIDAH